MWGALDGQTGQLDKANGRADDILAVLHACRTEQDRVNAALSPRPWWKRLAR